MTGRTALALYGTAATACAFGWMLAAQLSEWRIAALEQDVIALTDAVSAISDLNDATFDVLANLNRTDLNLMKSVATLLRIAARDTGDDQLIILADNISRELNDR